MTGEIKEEILTLAKEYEAYVKEQRRYFHIHPEVSGEEVETSKRLKAETKAMGLEVQELKGTGFIGILDTGRPGKTLVIRSDIDALPMDESGENLKGPKTCVSAVPGVFHGCGHDAHMAIALGVMKVLCRLKDRLSGKILFAFEEGEERGSGVEAMLEALKEWKPDGVYANHVTAFMDTGTICADGGPRMAGAIGIDMTVHGQGGHGSRPDLSVNPIIAACQIVNQLSVAWATRIDVTKTVTLSIGQIKSGQQSNIIPDDAYIGGSCRFYDLEEAKKAEAIICEVAEGVAKVNRCTVTMGTRNKILVSPVVNDQELAELSREGIQEILPQGTLISDVKWFASESFSRYTGMFPCVLNFIGIRNEEKGTGAEHHNGRFDVDEDALQTAVIAAAKFAVDFL